MPNTPRPGMAAVGMALAALGFLIIANAGAQAACTRLSLAQTRPAVTNFLVRPSGLLERNSNGGPLLVSSVRLLLTAQPAETIEPVLTLVRIANRFQRRDIGEAFGAAARECLTAAQSYDARRLDAARRTVSDSEFVLGYARGFDDQSDPTTGSAPKDLPPPSGVEPHSSSIGLGSVIPGVRGQGLSNPLTPVR